MPRERNAEDGIQSRQEDRLETGTLVVAFLFIQFLFIIFFAL